MYRTIFFTNFEEARIFTRIDTHLHVLQHQRYTQSNWEVSHPTFLNCIPISLLFALLSRVLS